MYMSRVYITEDGKIIRAKNFKKVAKIFEGTLFFDAYTLGYETGNYLQDAVRKSIFFVNYKSKTKKGGKKR